LSIGHRHKPLDRRRVGGVDLFEGFEIRTQHIIDIDLPEVLIAPPLPLVGIGIWNEVLLEEDLEAFSIVRRLSETTILLMGYTSAQFNELKPNELFVRVVALVFQLNVGGDEQPVDCGLRHVVVDEVCFATEDGEVVSIDGGEGTGRAEVEVSILQENVILLDLGHQVVVVDVIFHEPVGLPVLEIVLHALLQGICIIRFPQGEHTEVLAEDSSYNVVLHVLAEGGHFLHSELCHARVDVVVLPRRTRLLSSRS